MSRLRVLFGLALCAGCLGGAGADAPPTVTRFGRLPLTFEKNTGRYDKRVRFLTRTRGATVFVTANEMVMVLPGKASGEGRGVRSERDWASGGPSGPSCPSRQSANHVLRMKLVGANAKAVATGLEKQPGIVNYFIGNDPKKWRTRVPTYAKAKLAGVYTGIDVVYYGTEPRAKGQEPRAGDRRSLSALSSRLSALEYDFILRPGADPKRIKLAFEGADRVRVADGDLILSTPAGEVRMKRPYAYQVVGGKRVQVACDYTLRQRTAALRVARYDASKPLVVDPVLEYATYLGGDVNDWAAGIAVDSTGAAYVTGWTDANRDFPTTPGAYKPTGGSYLFVTKLDPTGNYLMYSTFIGGAYEDRANAISVDAAGAAYVAGKAKGAVPTTAGTYQTAVRGGFDGFLMKLDPTGSALAFSTRLGGASDDAVLAIALDAGGAAFVAGETDSSAFPTTTGAYQTSFDGSAREAFVAKVNASGSDLIYSTLLGRNSGVTSAYAIATDSAGAAYVAGLTKANTFPTTPGAFQRTFVSPGSAFVAKLDPAGSTLVYSTYLGGAGGVYYPDGNCAKAIAVDNEGCAYVAGHTDSRSFPTTPGAFQTTCAGGNTDAFITKLDPTGSGLVYSTYLGGSGITGLGGDSDWAYALHVDGSGVATVAGRTDSKDFPVTPYAYQVVSFGGYDGFVTRVSPSGAELLYSTYFPGASGETILGMAVDHSGAVYAAGRTSSESLPATPGAFADELRGSSDAFLAKLGTRTWTPTTLSVLTAAGTVGQTIALSALYAVAGSGEPLAGYDVRFWVAGAFLGIATTDGSGTATLAYAVPTGLAPWAAIEASCAGDAAYRCASGAGLLIVNRAATALAVDDASGVAGNTVLLSAALTRVRDAAPLYRRITFTDNGTRIGFATTSSGGRTVLSYQIPEAGPLGPHMIGAQFAGDADYEPSEGVGTLYVISGTTQYTIDRTGTITEHTYLRQYDLKRTTDNALLAGRTISFTIDGTEVGTAVTNAGGDSSLLWTIASGPATRTITTAFAGEALHAPSSASATLTAQTHATKMSGVNRDGKITAYRILKAWLYRLDNTPVVGKAISFRLDGTLLGTDNTRSTGLAQIGYTIEDGAGAGTRTILAEWAGDGGYLASSCTNTLNVLKATPYVWVMPRSVPQGGVARLYAYFRRLADYQKQVGKTVTFRVDGTWIADVVTGSGADAGIGRYNYTTVEPVGNHTLRCEFAGDAWVDAGYAEATLTLY